MSQQLLLTVAFLSFSALHLTINMKFLVLAACVAVSSAQGFFGLQSHPNGAVTPVDEPAVAAARADHIATKFGAGYGYAGYAPAYAAGYGYAGPLNLNTQLIGHPNGAVVPLDEPAVAAARAAHLDTQAAEYAASAPIVAAAPVVATPAVAAAPVEDIDFTYAGPLNLNTKLVGYSNGAVVPADEPAVAAARADHLASKGAAYAAAAPIVAAVPAVDAGYSYSGPLNLNTELVDYPNGAVVPVDEPAVVAARADHLAAYKY